MEENDNGDSGEILVRPLSGHMPPPNRPRRSTRIAAGAGVAAVIAVLAVFAVLRSEGETAASTSTTSTTGSTTSLPMESWQRANGSPSNDRLQAVTATESRLVAVGHTYGDDIDPSVWLSDDGVNWTPVARNQIIPGGLGDQAMYSVVSWRGGLVAVGTNEDDAAVWTSPDGRQWSPAPGGVQVLGEEGKQAMSSVTFGDQGFVAVGFDSAEGDEDAAVWTSVDGFTWSRVAHDEDAFGGGGDQVMNAVAFGNGLFVAVGQASMGDEPGAAVWVSSDGLAWSRIVGTGTVFGDGVTPTEMNAVVVGDSGFVAVGRAEKPPGQGPAMWTSPDGLEWSRVPDDKLYYYHAPMYGMYGMYGVAASEQGLVAVGYGLCDYCAVLREDSIVWETTDGASIVWQTADGVSWASTLGDIYAAMVAVTAGGPGFVAVGHWYNQAFSDGPPIWYGPPATSPTTP